jgi:hypothetical protein
MLLTRFNYSQEEKETADRIASTMAAAKAEEARSKPSSPSTQTMQRQQQEDAASVLARMKAMEEGGSGVAEVKPAVAESSAAAAAAAAQGEAAAAAAAAAPVPQSPPQTKTLARGKVPPPPQTQTLKRGEERDAASSSGGGVSGFWAADKWAGMGRIGGARRETSRDAGGQASKKPRLGSMFRDSGVLKPFRSWAKTWGSIGGGYVDDDDEVGGGEKDKASKAKRVAAVNEKEAKPVLKPRPVNAITPRGGGEYDLPHQVLFDTAAQTVAEAVNSLQPVGGQSDDLPQQVTFCFTTISFAAVRCRNAFTFRDSSTELEDFGHYSKDIRSCPESSPFPPRGFCRSCACLSPFIMCTCAAAKL